jgi:hypothetical protein
LPQIVVINALNEGDILKSMDFNKDNTLGKMYDSEYDEKGNLIELKKFDEEGKLIDHCTYKYNNKSELIDAFVHISSGNIHNSKAIYKYNS